MSRTCTNCGASVSEDEQFCPECGQWVDPLEEDFQPFTLGEEPPPEAEYEDPLPADVEAPPEVTCPSCGAPNPAYNRHCEECGARIAQGPLPVAPQPPVRTTAGGRALMALAALIMVVALAALLVNLFSSDETVVAEEQTTTSTSEVLAIRELEPVSVEASSEFPNWPAEALIDDDPTNRWNDASLQGEGASLEFFFGERVQITSIVIQNVTDEEAFHRNFRIRGYQIQLDDLDQVISGELDDTMQPQTIQLASVATTRVTLTVTSTYPAETFNGEPPFAELALQEVKFFGRPAQLGS